MSEKITVGIMGCANIAKRSLIPAFAKHSAFRVEAIASRASEKAKALAEANGCRAGSYEALVQDENVCLVYCPLPTGMHYEWVRKCLLSGKHVLCEKSLGCSYGEVAELTSLARERKLLLMESFQFRFHAQNVFVKRLLAENRIGRLRNLFIRFGIPPFPEGAKNIRYSRDLGGGALLDNGAYTIKATTYLLDGLQVEVLAAMADAGTPELGNVDLTGSIMMAAEGVSVQAAYGFDHFYQNGYEIWGTEGKISTTRAFTARSDYAAPVIIETQAGREERTFRDDHFARLLDHVSDLIERGDFAGEYGQNLQQARLIEAVRSKRNEV